MRPLFPHHINFIRRSLRAPLAHYPKLRSLVGPFRQWNVPGIKHFEMISDSLVVICKDVMEKCLYLSTLLCYPARHSCVSNVPPLQHVSQLHFPAPLFSLSWALTFQTKTVVPRESRHYSFVLPHFEDSSLLFFYF